MKLSQIIETGALDVEALGPEASNIEIAGLTADSREVRPGYLFAALPGVKVDGVRFVAGAVKAGAVAVLVSADAELPELEGEVAVLRSANPRRDLALMAARFFGKQPQTAVAVTGTSGKTSVVEFTRQILAANGLQAASVGTIGVVKPDGGRYGSLTTPDPVSLHRLLAELADEGVTHVAFEASSHGLDQHRLDGVRLTAGAFTNLGRDHLDYHPDVASYLAAKMRLFKQLLQPGQTAVINTDGATSGEVADVARGRGLKVFEVGRGGDQLKLVSVRREGFAQVLTVEADGGSHEVRLPLIGDYQVENALVAAGLAIAAGVPSKGAISALETLKGVPGRLEIVGEVNGGLVVVDYAHKPEALTAALQGVRPFVTGKLICVFGCGGDRDKGKREIMGGIAAKDADVAVVTDDNPRSEKPASIRAEIMRGCPDAREIGDRRKAIEWAVGQAGEGDVVLIAGKGHETGQIVGDTVLPFSDHEVARGAIAGASGQGEVLWAWDELVAAAQGEPDGEPQGGINGISIDSRSVGAGDLFVALKDKRDGHEFVSAAFNSGAAAALVCRDYQRRPGDGALLRVEDTLKGLERIGMAARARLAPDAKVIAVTGSAGKTTTKEMLKAGLSRLGPTHAADKSFNNHWGVPLTLSRMPRGSKFGVFEIGMNHAGEIAPLAKMVRPDVALVMNVLEAHLGHFASTKEIAEEKAQIFTGLVDGGTAIYNADSAHADILSQGAEASGGAIATFGVGPECDARAAVEKGLDASVAFKDGVRVQSRLPVPGHHIAMNAAGALLAVRAAGGDVERAAKGFEDLGAPEGRGARYVFNIPGGQFLLIDESYNANPGSMSAAIQTAREAVQDDFKRLVLVLGDMLELGEHSIRLHLGLKADIDRSPEVEVFTAGDHMAVLFDALGPQQQGGKGRVPSDIESDLIAAIRPGDVVMIKGSNGAKTWQLAEALRRQFAD